MRYQFLESSWPSPGWTRGSDTAIHAFLSAEFQTDGRGCAGQAHGCPDKWCCPCGNGADFLRLHVAETAEARSAKPSLFASSPGVSHCCPVERWRGRGNVADFLRLRVAETAETRSAKPSLFASSPGVSHCCPVERWRGRGNVADFLRLRVAETAETRSAKPSLFASSPGVSHCCPVERWRSATFPRPRQRLTGQPRACRGYPRNRRNA